MYHCASAAALLASASEHKSVIYLLLVAPCCLLNMSWHFRAISIREVGSTYVFSWCWIYQSLVGSCQMYAHLPFIPLTDENHFSLQCVHYFGVTVSNMTTLQASGMSCIMTTCTAEFCAITISHYPDDTCACLERTGRERFRSWPSNC